jgi:hypothetical protein
VYNLVAWILGGCGLPGIRKKEPKERITIIGLPPQPTAMTVFFSYLVFFYHFLARIHARASVSLQQRLLAEAPYTLNHTP